MKRIFGLLCVCAIAAAAAENGDLPPGCLGATSLGKFRLSVSVPWKGGARPVMEVASIPTGARLIWDPVHLAPRFAKSGEIAALIITKTNDELMVLDAHKAAGRTEWELPRGANVVALVLGPDGLSMNKVKSLVTANEDLLPQLAAYAQQTSAVESLVQTLADSQQSPGGADAALRGFSSRYGVAMPKLDPNAPTSQNASALLAALMPTAGTYDPLAPAPAQMAATTGLAASVAGLFFGNGVGLATGGVALVANLKGAIFPNTDFRSVYAQSSGGTMTFCAKAQTARVRTRTAYLWAYKAPGLPVPAITLTGGTYLPLGVKSTLKLKAGENTNPKDLVHARDWRLVPAGGGTPTAVPATAGADGLALDLTKVKATPGDYQVEAGWDWDTVTLGTVHLRPFADFSHVQLAPASHDKLIEGSGTVTAELTGADFEFVEKASIEKASARPNTKPSDVVFELPLGPRQGEQKTIQVDLDTSTAGAYKLLLAQSDGTQHAIPITVLPPNPKLSNLPLRVNAGEAEAPVRLEGSGLDRIEAVTTDAGAVTGSVQDGCWRGKLKLKSSARPGDSFAIRLKVQGLEAPLTVADALIVVGARPKILSAEKSPGADAGIEVRPDEVAAGANAGFVLHVAHLTDPAAGSETPPRLELGCRTGELRKRLALSPSDTVNGATLSVAGADSLYLSLDPGQVGYPGCELTATLAVEPRGTSKPVVLGRVVRIPALGKFTLSTEQLAPNQYAGVIEGRDLDVIERAGWDPQNGLPVAGIPTPVSPTGQTLKIAVPWPAPAPHAPLYIWLRGEKTGRKTKLTE
ncbi:MAG TPA: hypothetical protein VKX45_08470 [Bryobacteraceae bacterium]|nr:hypothetical protein [Bryobacteraceae bacterium]